MHMLSEERIYRQQQRLKRGIRGRTLHIKGSETVKGFVPTGGSQMRRSQGFRREK